MTSNVLNGARWVAPDRRAASPVTIRRFTCGSVRNAQLCVSGLGYFEARINGAVLGREFFEPPASDYFRRGFTRITYPCRDRFTHRVYYRTFDVTPYLTEGENLLEIQTGGGFFVQTERLAEGEMTYSDRTQCIYALTLDGQTILSDGSETWRESEIRRCELFLGETVDARFRPDGERPVTVVPPRETILTPEDGVPDRLIRVLSPVLLGERDGRRIYDAGENISGFVRLRTHAPAGTAHVLRFAETLAEDGTLDFASTGGQHRCASGEAQIMSDTFLCAGGDESFAPKFVWHAFRYFDVTGEIDSAEVCVIHADTPAAASFSSDCEGMNFLFDAYLRTQRNNLHGSTPMDCPHRERLGYTGDGQVCAPSAMLLLDCRPLYRKWIRDILDCQDPDTGHVQHTAPFQGGGGGPGGWGAAVVTVPYAYYRQYGALSELRAAYPAMRRWVSYMESRSENGRIVREEEGGWCLGDWCFLPSGKLPEPFVNTALYARALRILCRIAALLGCTEDIPVYRAAEERAVRAVREDYEGLRNRGSAMVYACVLGLEDVGRLSAYYEELGHFDTGFLATDLLMELLWENGYADTAHRLLSSEDTGSYLYMKRHGATTIWERWTGASHDHPMFGACARQLITGLLGIRQTEESAGWSAVRLTPALPAAMRHAEGSVATPCGVISVSLRREADGVHASVSVPPSVHGTMCVRGRDVPLGEGKNEFIL